MLSNEQKEYLKQYHENYEKAEKTGNFSEMNNIRQMNKRIRDKALNMIHDLTLIAQMMPESQKDQIFTEYHIIEFARAILVDRENYNSIGLFNDEARHKLPEPIYNSRIFNLGVLFSMLGMENAYQMISWKLRLKHSILAPSSREKLELILAVNQFKGMFEKKNKEKK